MTQKIENTTRIIGLALRIWMACMLYLSIPGSSQAQVPSPSQEELVKIALKDEYGLTLRFNAYPAYAFNLWLPELAIFDSDLDRSKDAHPIDGVWLARRYGNLQVTGRLTTEIKSMDFKCTLIPISASAIMLELEVMNSGQVEWSDYAQLAICLAPVEGNTTFSDTSGERSFLLSQNSDIRSITEIGVVGDYNHYAVGGHHDQTDSIQRAQINDGFVSRKSSDGKISISFMWEDAARADVNPGGLDCIHSHPAVGPLKAGDSKSIKGFIMIQEGTPRDHYALMKDLIDKYGKQ